MNLDTTGCPITGTAIVQRVGDEPRWLQADESIHVAPDFLDDKQAVAFIETRYRIGEKCPTSDAVHAYREGDA